MRFIDTTHDYFIPDHYTGWTLDVFPQQDVDMTLGLLVSTGSSVNSVIWSVHECSPKYRRSEPMNRVILVPMNRFSPANLAKKRMIDTAASPAPACTMYDTYMPRGSCTNTDVHVHRGCLVQFPITHTVSVPLLEPHSIHRRPYSHISKFAHTQPCKYKPLHCREQHGRPSARRQPAPLAATYADKR